MPNILGQLKGFFTQEVGTKEPSVDLINTAIIKFLETGSQRIKTDSHYLMGIDSWFDGTCFQNIVASHRDLTLGGILQWVYDSQSESVKIQFMQALGIAFEETIKKGTLHQNLLYTIVEFVLDNDYYELGDLIADLLPSIPDPGLRNTLILHSAHFLYEAPAPSQKLIQALLNSTDRPSGISAHLVTAIIRSYQGTSANILTGDKSLLHGFNAQLETVAQYPSYWDRLISDITTASWETGIPDQVKQILDRPDLLAIVSEARDKQTTHSTSSNCVQSPTIPVTI